MKVGVISDTHNFLDPRVLELFQGVDHILHAGDIGLPRIILDLEQIAPVSAVLGNTDDPGFRYPLTEVVELAGKRVLLHHIVNPNALAEPLQARIEVVQPHIVVFGHTHKPFQERRDHILFFNPGYAGQFRFNMPRSVALLHLAPRSIRSEFLQL